MKLLSPMVGSIVLTVGLILAFQVPRAYPQSQALDAQIDGAVADMSGSIIPNVSVTAVNVNTGARRTALTNEQGTFRFPILSLGSYTVIAERAGFKRFERHGIILSAGQTALVTITLKPGSPQETVTVTSDAAIADASKLGIGRHVNERELKNLPLVSRNPYNHILLQPGVYGRQVGNPVVVDLSANGLRRRVAYNLDGNYNSEANLSGFRLNLISEVYVKEVQLLTRGYSAEFGYTAGAVVNVVTPSGTNNLHGEAAFLYRPSGYSSKPFDFTRGDSDPNLNAYGIVASIGGRIIKDRWHFYGGYELPHRNSVSPITINSVNRDQLIATGLSPSIFVNSKGNSSDNPYFIFRTDARLSAAIRVNLRYNRSHTVRNNTGIGGLDTTERSYDVDGYDHAFGAQLVTSFSETFFNEFRFHYAKRHVPNYENELSAESMAVSISGVANFGRNPIIGTTGPQESGIQFQNAVTKIFDAHSFKIGGGINFNHGKPRSEISARYIFSSIQAYADAVNGIDRRSYTQYQETFGDNEISSKSIFANWFIQDDWRPGRRLKIAAGLRYEHYRPPDADANSPLPDSREFNTDINNFGPRLGLVYLLRDGKYRTVLRTGSGMHYDPPIVTMYRRAILNNGDPRYFSFSFSSGNPNAPEFPNRLGVFPAGTEIPPRNVDAVAADFRTMYAVHSNVQVEQALAEDLSLTAAYVHSFARHIPIYKSINCLPTGATLADGRPIYGTVTVNAAGRVTPNACTNRILPQFNIIKLAESAGNLNYHGFIVQLTKRFSDGFQLNANYTLSRARDDAPEENGPGSVALSDPSNRRHDLGNAYGDVAQVFNLSMVARTKVQVGGRFLNYLLNGNQLGLILVADSGENFDITAAADLNLDGVLGSDRPVGISRNSARLPAFWNVDARYSRFFRLSERLSFELYAEATNVFNIKHVSFYGAAALASNNIFTSPVNPLTGELRGQLPDLKDMSPAWRDSRQMQIGAKIRF